MTYNERYNDDDEDSYEPEIDQPSVSYAFSWLDVPGALLMASGNALQAFGRGVGDLGDVLRINAWHGRTLKALDDEAAKDRIQFDTIISQQPVLLDEPEEES